MTFDAQEVYQRLRKAHTEYNEEIHCPLILKIMADEKKGRVSAFCVEAFVDERTFYNWVNAHPLFSACYFLGKMYARENWEKEGDIIKHIVLGPGENTYRFEHWKMIGWSRFGISKNSRIRLDLKPTDNPAEHYKQLLQQASNGDFTASEIKQLMEAINVGLNAHQVFELQKQIDELKSDLTKMDNMQNAQHSLTNKGIAQKD